MLVIPGCVAALARAMLALCLLSLVAGPVAAGERRALIIANADYRVLPRLPGVVRDADLLKPALEAIGFIVTVRRDRSLRQMIDDVEEHAAALEAAGAGSIGVLYYSGHGVATGGQGQNYLLPVGLESVEERFITSEALSLQRIAARLSVPGQYHFIILDACRDELTRLTRGQRGLRGGFSSDTAPRDVMFVFSTEPDRPAVDGGADGSPYSRALTRALARRCLDYQSIFKLAQIDVARQTADQQRPWQHDGIAASFALAAGCPDVSAGRPSGSETLVRIPVGALRLAVTGAVGHPIRAHVMVAVRDTLPGATLSTEPEPGTTTHVLHISETATAPERGGCGWQLVTRLRYEVIEQGSGRRILSGQSSGAVCYGSSSTEEMAVMSERAAAAGLVRDIAARIRTPDQ